MYKSTGTKKQILLVQVRRSFKLCELLRSQRWKRNMNTCRSALPAGRAARTDFSCWLSWGCGSRVSNCCTKNGILLFCGFFPIELKAFGWIMTGGKMEKTDFENDFFITFPLFLCIWIIKRVFSQAAIFAAVEIDWFTGSRTQSNKWICDCELAETHTILPTHTDTILPYSTILRPYST